MAWGNILRRISYLALLMIAFPLWGGGFVVAVNGDVYLTKGKSSLKLKGGTTLNDGDIIDASLGKVMVLIDDDEFVVVRNGMFKIQRIEDRSAVYLFDGGARWVVSSEEKRNFYTPTAVITSKNGNVLIKYLKNSNSSEVYLLDGKCSVRNIKDEIKGRIKLSPLKITVVGENKPPASMLLSLSIQDKKEMVNQYSIVQSFRNRYQERKDLVELGVHLYDIESSKTSVFVYPGNTPFPGAYNGNYINRVFKLKGNGSLKVRWKLDETNK